MSLKNAPHNVTCPTFRVNSALYACKSFVDKQVTGATEFYRLLIFSGCFENVPGKIGSAGSAL